MANDKILEALARIEHKTDLVLEIVAKLAGFTNNSQLPKVGDTTHPCILCSQPVQYDLDINEGVVLRKCGCKTGKIALNLGAFAPPTPLKKVNADDEQREQEADSNSDRTRRPGRR